MKSTIENALNHLQSKYGPEVVLLYGSFHTQTITPESDIDLIAFAPIENFIHDSTIIDSHQLDAWIHPLGQITEVEQFLHASPCSVLLDKDQAGQELLKKIEKHMNENNKPISRQEKDQLDSWIAKMLKRAKNGTVEGNYRYNWLLHDFPELYAKYSGHPYHGPIKTLALLKNSGPELYQIYVKLLAGDKNLDALEGLYDNLTSGSKQFLPHA